MEIVKLSSNGQIAIPQSILDHLQLPVGAEFLVAVTATGLSLTPATLFPRTSAAEVKGMLAKPGRTVPSDQELRALLKNKAKNKDDAGRS